MSQFEQIKQDFMNRWLNNELSMNLAPNHVQVDNANDILYQSIFLNLLKQLNEFESIFVKQAEHACNILRKSDGIFYRFTSDHNVKNSHDNYEGLASLQVFDVPNIANEICERGERDGWNFEVEEESEFSFVTLWQPGTVAFMQLCDDRKPYILNLIWLCIGIIVGSFQWTKHTHHKCWHVVWTVREKIKKHAEKKSWKHIVFALSFSCLIYDIVSIIVFGNRHQAIVNYYEHKDHPNVRLALELIRKEST